MNYTSLRKDDFDKSFKYQKQSFLCYSEKKLKELHPDKDYKIAGLARKSDEDTEHKLLLGNKTMAVFDTDKDNMMYKNIGFIPVGEKEYIALQESRIPFIAYLGSMTAATLILCAVLINGNPVTPAGPEIPDDIASPEISERIPLFNPLPPVDTNIEDCIDTILGSENTGEEKPEGGGKVTISYKPSANVSLSSGEVNMEYQNPASSSHDAVLSLYVVSGDEEYLVANSGRIPAGKQLRTMQLTADKKLFSSEGRYDAEYRVFYYDPETGERALSEAVINDITLTVRNS